MKYHITQFYKALFILISLLPLNIMAQPLGGTYTIGNTGTYSSITQAVSDLRSKGVNNAVVFELQSNYNHVGETFPITIPLINGVSASNTITIRPAALAGLITIDAGTQTVFKLDSAKYVTIDGRPGGTGFSRNLVLSNSTTFNPGIYFLNDACFNQIIYDSICIDAGAGINFGNTNQIRGNDSNLIAYNDIRSHSLKSNGLISSIGTNNATRYNQHNIIRGNRIGNFITTAVSNISSYGIYIGFGNNDWIIEENSIFQSTELVSAIGLEIAGIYVQGETNSNYIIRNNFIGGSTAFCGGNQLTVRSNVSQWIYFTGIRLSSNGPSSTSLISGNEISNINLDCGSDNLNNPAPPFFAAIATSGTNTHIQIIDNIIGSQDAGKAIVTNIKSNVTNTTTGIVFTITTNGTVLVKNNRIGNIRTFASLPTAINDFIGIRTGAASSGTSSSLTIEDNIIGNNLPRNISVQRIAACGIKITQWTNLPAPAIIRNNLVQNLHTESTSSIGNTLGISILLTKVDISNNTIKNLSSHSYGQGLGLEGINGISLESNGSIGLSYIRKNHIYNLYNDSAFSNFYIYGIKSTGVNNQALVENNKIHDLHTSNQAGIADTSYIYGISMAYTTSCFNNMIRLGFDSSGRSFRSPSFIYGIFEGLYDNIIAHNSIYIGGDSAAALASYAAFSNGPVAPHRISNNIFVNNRSSIHTNGNLYHFAYGIKNSSFYKNRSNIYYAVGNGGGLITTSDTNMVSMADISRMLNDSGSQQGNPNFINPEGTASTFDLHLQSPTPAEGKGELFPIVTLDYDSNVRSTLTPVDIGTYAGNFTRTDVAPPAIIIKPFPNTAFIVNRTLQAIISDVSGIYLADTLKPQIYFKKGVGGAWQSTAGMIDSGDAYVSKWSFTINSSLMGSLALNDTVYYFIAAQDSSVNRNLTGGIGNGTTSIRSFPNKTLNYRILRGFSGNYNIGAGQTYTSLTNTSGIFDALNKGIVTGDVNLIIQNDLLAETGLFALNKWNNETAIKNNVKILPGSAVRKTISGNVTSSLLVLNKVEGFSIDGSFNGTGSYLLFRNTNTSGRTITMQNGCRLDTVLNCIIEGNNVNSSDALKGVFSIISTDLNSNDSILVQNNLVQPISGGLADYLLYVYSPVNMSEHANAIHVINNTFTNCRKACIYVHDNVVINNWKIYGNNLYNISSAGSSTSHGIYTRKSKNILVRQNIIGGSGPGLTGMMSANGAISPIFVRSGTSYAYKWTATATIDSNVIGAISARTVTGIVANNFYRVNLSNNMIGNALDAADSIVVGEHFTGIVAGGNDLTDDSIFVKYNTIKGVRAKGIYAGSPVTSRIEGIQTDEAYTDVSYNTIHDLLIHPSAVNGYIYTLLSMGQALDSLVKVNVHHNIIRDITSYSTTSIINPLRMENEWGSIFLHHNKVENFINYSAEGSNIGITYISGDQLSINNNQISLSAPSNGFVLINGIEGSSVSNFPSSNNIFNNTILMSGLLSRSHPSYAIYTPNVQAKVYNNILYNRCVNPLYPTVGFGFSTVPDTNFSKWFAHNLIVVDDTSYTYRISNSFFGVESFSSLFSGVNHRNRNTNWVEQASNLPAHLLFKDTASDLDINTSDDACWYANGKGIALAHVNDDLHGDARSTSISAGTTDIGADEFTPDNGVLPQLLSVSTVTAGDQDFVFAGRNVARINWLAGGTRPTTAQLRYYSGVPAPSLLPGADHFNAYHDLILTGGSNYNYTIAPMYDSASMGTVANINDIRLATNQGTWTVQGGGLAPISGLYTHGANRTFTGSALFTGTTATNPLPVKLLAFSGIKQNKDVLLNWKTASEINTDKFVIERSYNGKIYEAIGEVKAKGNTSSTTSYQFTDKNARPDQTIYYRLNIKDHNGYAELSKTVIIETQQTATSIQVYPNPSASNFFVQVNSTKSATAKIVLYDMTGRVVQTMETLVNKGLQDIEISTSHLQAGIYFVTTELNGEKQTIKVIKQ